MRSLIVYLISINVLTFLIYGINKWKARRGKWRIGLGTDAPARCTAELQLRHFRKLLRMRCAPFLEVLVADNLPEFLVLLGIVFLQFLVIDLSAKSRHAGRGIAGTHTGATAGKTTRPHSSGASTRKSTLTTGPSAAGRSREVAIRTGTAEFKVLTAILDIALEELVHLLDLFFIEPQFCGHLVGLHLRLLLNGRALFHLGTFRFLRSLAARLCCRGQHHRQSCGHKNHSFHRSVHVLTMPFGKSRTKPKAGPPTCHSNVPESPFR